VPAVFKHLSPVRILALLLCCALFFTAIPSTGFANAQKKNYSSAKKQHGKSVSRSAAGKKRYNRSASPSYSYGYKSCVIYNANNNKVLFTHDGDRKIPPASLTKILAMYVAEDAIRNRNLNRNARVTVSAKAAAAGGSRMGLHAGDSVPLDDLLRGMAVASGNDASIAVAEYIGGSEQQFVNMMNQKARAIAMRRSTFKNVNGLPAPGQYTTARDMLVLARSYLNTYPGNLAKYHNQSVHVYKSKYSCNANPLLGVLEGADGLKTGFVSASGYNLIATAKRGNQRYIGVILGAPTSAMRAQQARTLMEACFTRPSSFGVSKADVNTNITNKQKKPAAVASRPAKGQNVKSAATASSSKKQAVKSRNSRKDSATASGRSKTVNRPLTQKTAGAADNSRKNADKKQELPKGKPLVLESYS